MVINAPAAVGKMPNIAHPIPGILSFITKYSIIGAERISKKTLSPYARSVMIISTVRKIKTFNEV